MAGLRSWRGPQVPDPCVRGGSGQETVALRTRVGEGRGKPEQSPSPRGKKITKKSTQSLKKLTLPGWEDGGILLPSKMPPLAEMCRKIKLNFIPEWWSEDPSSCLSPYHVLQNSSRQPLPPQAAPMPARSHARTCAVTYTRAAPPSAQGPGQRGLGV